MAIIDMVAKEFHMSPKELLNESLKAYLGRKLSRIEADIFVLAKKLWDKGWACWQHLVTQRFPAISVDMGTVPVTQIPCHKHPLVSGTTQPSSAIISTFKP